MKLVVGLGNPGREYENTRHNVGFRVVDELAGRWRIEVSRRQFHGWLGGGQLRGEKVLLLKPATFMNRSGQSVQSALAFHKLGLADLLVVVDDMALPVGRLRVRKQGSAGGHNGLTDIIRALGGDGFARLRIGIGQVAGERMVGHVLGVFSPTEAEAVEPALKRAADAVECWVAEGIDAAMNRYNRGDEPAEG